MIRICLTFVFFLLISCAQGPTRVQENLEPQGQRDFKDSLLLDVRPSFEYAISKVPGAISIDPLEFFESEGRFKGAFKKDRFFMARRLARIGIDPDTRVVIVGDGRQGRGVEGRMAWVLMELGVNQVELATIEQFRRPKLQEETAPPAPKKIWKPVSDETKTEISLEEFERQFLSGKSAPDVRLIDARSEAEFHSENPRFPLDAINIPWAHFFKDDLKVNFDLKNELSRIEIHPNTPIVCLSNEGGRSSAVVWALNQMGYSNVRTLSVGMRAISRDKKTRVK